MISGLRGVKFPEDSELQVVPPEEDQTAKVTQAASPALPETVHNNTPAESPRLRQRVQFQELPDPPPESQQEPVEKTNSCWKNCLAWLKRCRH